jgi:hypothetical protein
MAKYVRAILWDQQREDYWWPSALTIAADIRNSLESDTVDGSHIPEVEWTQSKVDTRHFRVPLCTTWSFIDKGKRDGGTLGDRRMKGVLVGYARDSPCYEVYDPIADRVYNRRYEDVTCDERLAVPSDGRTMQRYTGGLFNIAESDEENEGGADEAVVGTVDTSRRRVHTVNDSNNETAVVHEPAVPSSFMHEGSEFFKLTRARSVEDLAGLFAVDPSDYLALLRQYDGWYQNMKNIRSVVKAGADVPVPVQAPEEPVGVPTRAPTTKKARQRKATRAAPSTQTLTAQHERALTEASNRGSSSTASTSRRSLRLRAAMTTAAKDAAALMSLAVDFERQAKAFTRTPEGTPADDGTAFYIADCAWNGAGSANDPVFISSNSGSSTTGNKCYTSVDTALYDDEPHDSVYFEALAAGKIPLTTSEDIPTPKSQKQAHSGPHRERWMVSERKEWDGLWAKGAFKDVKLDGQRLHHLLWVYKVKSDGVCKSRLCADGRQQDPSTYGDIASPTMRTTSFRLLLALAALKKWAVYADDATQAFLNAVRPKDKPLYASYPRSFKNPGRCLLVLRQLYGLHDAPMGFFECLRQHLVQDQSFVQSRNDRCMFVQYKEGSASEKARKEWVARDSKSSADSDETNPYPEPLVLGDVAVVVTVHVDDFASTGDDKPLAEYRRRLHKRFPCTGGLIDEYYGLGVKVDRVKGVCSLSACSYIGRMLKKLGVTKYPQVNTPWAADLELERLQGDGVNKALQSRYRTVVGCILHAAVTARPDVAAAARMLSAHLQHPGERHLRVAMRVVFYLATTRNLALTYGLYKDESGFYGTCDASHATEEGAKGVTGWAFHFAGGAIAWKSRTQGLVALSSTEAELIAVDEAARELRYLEKLLAEAAPRPTPIGQDNLSTCTLVGGTHFNPRTRHLALRYHHTGDLQRHGVLQVRYLPTQHMPSDLLTKGLPEELHRRHAMVLLGLLALNWSKRVDDVRVMRAAAKAR